MDLKIAKVVESMISNFDYTIAAPCIYNFINGFETGMYTRIVFEKLITQELNPDLLIALKRTNTIFMYSCAFFALVGICMNALSSDPDTFVKMFTCFGLIISIICKPSTKNITLTIACLLINGHIQFMQGAHTP